MIQEAASLWNGIKKYEEILGRNPGAYSFAPLAELYRRAGLLEDALAIASRGVALYPDFAAGQMALGRIYHDKMMQLEAVAAFESVVRITPENIEAQRLLAGFYREAGNTAAWERCLAIMHELDPESIDNGTVPSFETIDAQMVETAQGNVPAQTGSLQTSVFPGEADESVEEELLDADILDLTDELIEETADDVSYLPFAAAPDRPSLQASPVAPQPMADRPEQVSQQVPVATATIAELYVSQGFKDKGADVYRELLLADPENALYRRRFDELVRTGIESPLATLDRVEPVQAIDSPIVDIVASSRGVVETLQGWLSNIRRVKACRSDRP